MRIELGRPEVRVSQHFLHAAQIRASFEQMRGERVAQEVRVHALRIEACLLRQLPKDEEGSGARQRTSLRVQEELRPVSAVQIGTSAREVPAEGLDAFPPERDDPLLVALPDAPNEAAVEIDPAPLEPDGLADAQAGSVENLDERAVSQGTRCGAVGGIDQALHLHRGEGSREARTAAWQIDVGGGIVAARSEEDEVAVERSGGRGPARDRCRRLPTAS
jgi:hypothetical protein